MTDTNATTLRNALASAIKSHVADSGLTAKDAAAKSGVQLSRLYQVLRGDVEKISSDALVNILGGFGYRLTGINGSGSGTEIVLSLDKAESQALPEIESPKQPYEVGDTVQSADGKRWTLSKDGEFKVSSQENGFTGVYTGNGPSQVMYEDTDPDADRVVSDDE